MFYNISNIGPLEQPRWVIFEVYNISCEKSALLITNHLLLTANHLPFTVVISEKNED